MIQIEHLSHRYATSDSPALRDISLHINRGSCFGLLGPNGAGKTTLLSILTGLLKLQSGRVQIGDFDLTTQAQDIRRIIAIAPQDFAFYMNLTGRENLAFFADIYGLSKPQWRERLEFCVHACNLNELLDRRADHYSGGMKRRLNLAIALLNQPQVLYLDEPTVGVDALSRQTIIAAIKLLRSNGTTVIYTSHYMEEIETLCDHVAIIDRGCIRLTQSMDKLLQQNQKRTLQLVLAAPFSPSLLEQLAQWTPTQQSDRQIELMTADIATLPEITEICTANGYGIERLQYGVSRLEQTYLAVLHDGEPS